MPNGLDSIEAILTGDEEIPERVSNRLLLGAIRANYQFNHDLDTKYKELLRMWHETKSAVDDLDHQMKLELQGINKDVDDAKKNSTKWDRLLALATAIGAGLGYYLGQN